MDCIKLKASIQQREQSTKRQPTGWEKISANTISDRLVFKIYKELKQFDSKKTLIFKMGKGQAPG